MCIHGLYGLQNMLYTINGVKRIIFHLKEHNSQFSFSIKFNDLITKNQLYLHIYILYPKKSLSPWNMIIPSWTFRV